MNRNVLLAATASRWFGTARMPRSLTKAGFVVSLLAPRDSLAFRSRYIARVGVVRDTSTPMQWLLSLAAMVRDVAPDLIVPCDEVAFRLLAEFARDPLGPIRNGADFDLVNLVRQSLGNPAHYQTSIDKTALPQAAKALGIPVPGYGIARTLGDAVAHAARLGYPVVVKRRFGFASQGVCVAHDQVALTAAVRTLLQPTQIDLGDTGEPRLLVQSFVEGRSCAQTMVAWQGAALAGFARERELAYAPGKGASSVMRLRCNPSIRESTERLCREFGITGFLSAEFVAPAAGGPPLLLEINRRLESMTHVDEFAGVDMCSALFQRLAGLQQTVPRDMAAGDAGAIASFPREWLRDPDSPWLRDCPSDIPWDDPALFEAMVASRNE
jgi:predicted ATP-grasp superfamily ATP-dependent carboligase